MTRLVVVGASVAAVRAVETARRLGFRGDIVMIGEEPLAPYDRPPLSKSFLEAGHDEPPPPLLRPPSVLRDELNVQLRLGEAATGLDPRQRMVYQGESAIRFDRLIIATGARARRLPQGQNLAGVHYLRTLDDARAVRQSLDAGGRVVVVGAGFIGSEVASSAAKRGMTVTIVEAAPNPLAQAVGPEVGAAVATLHDQHGTTLLCGTPVAGLVGRERIEALRLGDGREVPADVVIVGIGTQPATEWLTGSGLRIDDGVVCDSGLCSSHHGIYAAGDVARWYNPLFDEHLRVEHWTNAADQAAAAVRNALRDAPPQPFSAVPYFWSDLYGQRIQFVGSPTADEVRFVDGGPGASRWVALYRRGERVIGAAAQNGQSVIMKYRALITARASWPQALNFAVGRISGSHGEEDCTEPAASSFRTTGKVGVD